MALKGDKILAFSYNYDDSTYILVVADAVSEQVNGCVLEVETTDEKFRFLFPDDIILVDVKKRHGYAEYVVAFNYGVKSNSEYIQTSGGDSEEEVDIQNYDWENAWDLYSGEEGSSSDERRKWLHYVDSD